MFNSIFGAYSGHASSLGQQSQYQNNLANPSAQNQFGSGMANAAYNANISAFQQAAQQQYLARMYSQALQPKEFRINGQDMDLQEFLNTLYPEDCAERTYLALKLTKGNEDD